MSEIIFAVAALFAVVALSGALVGSLWVCSIALRTNQQWVLSALRHHVGLKDPAKLAAIRNVAQPDVEMNGRKQPAPARAVPFRPNGRTAPRLFTEDPTFAHGAEVAATAASAEDEQ